MEKGAVDKLLATHIVLEETDRATYEGCTKDDDLQKLFVAISSRLLREASRLLGDEGNGQNTETFWDRLHLSASSRGQHYLPDVINTWAPLPSDGTPPPLAVPKGIIEIKRLPVDQENYNEWNWSDSDNEEEPAVWSAHVSGVHDVEALKEPVNTEEPTHLNGRNPEVATGSQTSRSGTQSSGSPERSYLGLKGPVDAIKDTDDAHASVPKKQRQDEPPLHNSLLPLYATKAMASSGRYYVVGLVVDRFMVTVCYFDRFLVACFASFSFAEEPSKLALVLYAMNRCDCVHAGFDHHLRTLLDNKLSQEVHPTDQVVGSVFEYPETSTSSGASFRVTDVIQRPDELIGRATMAYKVQLCLPDGSVSEEEVSFKLGWPPKSRFSDIKVVQTLKERLPKDSQVHLPNFKFTRAFTAEDLNLPWLRLGPNHTVDSHKGRVLGGVMGKSFHKLWEAGSMENFKQAWLDCVECLYYARKVGKVLHRDLSEGNLMVSKPVGDQAKGVLNDWDTAKFLDRDDDDLSEPEDQTRAWPFMALDLVLPKPSAHWFRHDLESLFWILVWAALHYDLEAGAREDTVHPTLQELVSNTRTSWQFKSAILSVGPDGGKLIREALKPGFTGLFEEWIEPLRKLFAKARESHHLRIATDQETNRVTHDGVLTFKTFMAAINVTPRTWGIPNYLDADNDF
ncbi:hypothetical protein FA13DRAFT_1666854 [Coprinellus micaceus]|uniref:Fungal-type protein kinase domain-containing protein n=1 Tax=Coprinellus micaceus TaxID=71717 RepID=A0A4Y7T030_COPMI|nr:hypothetical protein FA13DRAFT_1666854 [Coprinellus micaceus]